jgi:prevent-host-death family protein
MREAPAVPCPGPGLASLRRCTAGLGPKIAKQPHAKIAAAPVRSPRAAESLPGYPLVQISALESQRKFGEFLHQARRDPIEITRHRQREFVLMSAEHYDRLTAAARRSHRTVDASQVVIDAVERAGMDPEHAAPDELLK